MIGVINQGKLLQTADDHRFEKRLGANLEGLTIFILRGLAWIIVFNWGQPADNAAINDTFLSLGLNRAHIFLG